VRRWVYSRGVEGIRTESPPPRFRAVNCGAGPSRGLPEKIRQFRLSAALSQGKRICEKCRTQRRQQTKRDYMRTYMEQRRSPVSGSDSNMPFPHAARPSIRGCGGDLPSTGHILRGCAFEANFCTNKTHRERRSDMTRKTTPSSSRKRRPPGTDPGRVPENSPCSLFGAPENSLCPALFMDSKNSVPALFRASGNSPCLPFYGGKKLWVFPCSRVCALRRTPGDSLPGPFSGLRKLRPASFYGPAKPRRYASGRAHCSVLVTMRRPARMDPLFCTDLARKFRLRGQAPGAFFARFSSQNSGFASARMAALFCMVLASKCQPRVHACTRRKTQEDLFSRTRTRALWTVKTRFKPENAVFAHYPATDSNSSRPGRRCVLSRVVWTGLARA
jgi:hypothetical protein